MSLCWNVYIEDINEGVIKPYNILHLGSRFVEDLVKAKKKYLKAIKEGSKETAVRAEFTESVKRDLIYYFWGKCEWEILLTPWIPFKDKNYSMKIDAYDQVMMNFDVFIEYLIAHFKEIKTVK